MSANNELKIDDGTTCNKPTKIQAMEKYAFFSDPKKDKMINGMINGGI